MQLRPLQLRPFQALILPMLMLGLLGTLAQTASANFDYEVYNASFDVLPDFTQLTPDATGQSATIDLSVTSEVDTFALVFTNQINVPTAGIYEFFTNSDDGSRIYIDAALVVDNDGLHAPVQVANTVSLTAGVHSFRVEFFEKTGGQVLDVGYRTGNPAYDPIPADGQLSFVGSNESEFGQWGAVIQWPHIAISAANLPDGSVLAWSSTETNAFPSGPDFTHASVFDPVSETFLSVDSNFHDMFCAGVSSLENGVIVASGGNPSDRRTSSFDPATLSWSALADMNDFRWYGANATLPNNTIFSSFAKDAANRSEVYDPATDTWTPTPNANMQTLVNEQNAINGAPNPSGALGQEWWAHLAVAPQGDVFQGGPTQTWHRFDPIGGAPNVVLGQPIGDVARMYGNAITYDAGKVLLIGGADRRQVEPTSVNNVYLIDLNGPAPTVTAGAPMNHPRALSNTVTLPNGEILVIGGNRVAKIFSDEDSVLPAEIYTPATDTWREVDSITIPRNYHSTALLLKDARVLSAGGGACGNGCAANHLDGQIFSPPYLFESDDSPAIRPTLSVPVATQVQAGDDLVVTASAGTTSFSIVRLSATTHHLNTDQRFLPLASIDNGDGTFTVTFSANPNVLIVGNYWLFALDADGTPSVGENIQVIRDVAPNPNPEGAVYISDLAWTSEVNGLGPAERDMSNGDAAAADGGPITLDAIVYAKGVGVHAYSEIEVDLNGLYERFRSDIGLDDSRDGLCGDVHFEVDIDSVTAYVSSNFVDTTATDTIDLDVSGASTLTLKVFDDGATCGDHGDWANARLIPTPIPGYRYYRFRQTKLRDDATANSIQLAELALFDQGVRMNAVSVSNPGGNNPVGEEPFRADDDDVNTKWLDFNRGDLTYDYGANVVIDAYSITTAADAIERDPVRWFFEGSIDGVVWEILDDQTAQDFPTPTARLTAITPIDLVMLSPITALPAEPRHSTTLLVETSSGADRIWNVNPDNDTVSVSDDAGNLITEILVGDEPWSLAKQPGSNRVFVTNKSSSTIFVIDTLLLSVDHTVLLSRGAQPHGIVFSNDGAHYFVVLETLALLEKRLSIDDSLVDSVQLSGRPRHLGIRYDDSRIFVSNFVTPPIPGENTLTVDVANGAAEIFSVIPVSMTLAPTITLTHDDRSQSESQGPGMPNYLGAPVVSFDEQFAYVATKKDNVQSGALRMIPGMTFESTVRANSSRIILSTELEDPAFRVDHDNASVATGAALSGDDRYLFVTLETSRELAVYDTQLGFQLMRLPTGRAPQSVALSTDGSRAYVHNFMDRSISRFDLTQMLQTNLPATNVLASISVVATEALSPTVLLGKQHFYDAEDDRISLDNYISCASCHKNGKDDGRVWDLGGFGEGVRKTISLRGRGSDHGLSHWTGNFDEIHDFEVQLRALGLGLGFLTTAEFMATSDPLGPPKAGLSPDLDALAAYVESLTVALQSPHRPSAGTLSASAQLGQASFAAEGCLSCHGLPQLTDSPMAQRHDIGTQDTASGQRLNAPLDGFDTPGLLGVWASPPYLHDGEAQTIGAAITAHNAFSSLPAGTVDDLSNFLREAEPADLAVFVDTQAPLRSAGAPTGELPFGTTQAVLSLTTDESATCRYSASPGVDYASMTDTFSTTGGSSHSTTVTGLLDNMAYIYYVRCEDGFSNSNPDDFAISFNVAADTVAPIRSAGAPTGELPFGTTQTTLSLTTDEAGTCRYSPTPGTAYASMVDTFTTTGGTGHSTTVIGLLGGTAYAYYVRCVDGFTNANPDDFAIAFSVAPDTVAPIRSAGAPTGELPFGTTETSLSLTTDESATCRYSTSAGVAYASMTDTFTTTGSTGHSTTVTGLADDTAYTYHVRCVDGFTNANPDDFAIAFTVAPDTVAPIRSAGAPTGELPFGTTETSLSLTTDESATCRYSTSAGVAYASMTDTFTTTGGTGHSTTVIGLADDTAYTYHVRCVDGFTNANPDDFTIAFSVAPDTVAPIRSAGAPTGELPFGTIETSLSLTTDESSTCRYSTSAGVAYASMTDTFTTTGSTGHSTTVTGLVDDTAYSYYVRCVDGFSNANPDDFSIGFNIAADTLPPLRSNGAPAGELPSGTAETDLTLSTDESAICRYDMQPDTPFGSMVGVFTTTGGIAHSTTMSGLVDDSAYTYHVRCVDLLANENANDYTVNFTIAPGEPAPVPSISPGMLWLLALTIGGSAWLRLRRHPLAGS